MNVRVFGVAALLSAAVMPATAQQTEKTTDASALADLSATDAPQQVIGKCPNGDQELKGQACSANSAPLTAQMIIGHLEAMNTPSRSRSHRSHTFDMRMSFAAGSATLTPLAVANLEQFAIALTGKNLANTHYEIAGNTDSSGARTINIALSRARAKAVVEWLTAHGIAAERLVANGYGPDRPIPGTARSNPVNRRVEIARAA